MIDSFCRSRKFRRVLLNLYKCQIKVLFAHLVSFTEFVINSSKDTERNARSSRGRILIALKPSSIDIRAAGLSLFITTFKEGIQTNFMPLYGFTQPICNGHDVTQGQLFEVINLVLIQFSFS